MLRLHGKEGEVYADHDLPRRCMHLHSPTPDFTALFNSLSLSHFTYSSTLSLRFPTFNIYLFP